MNLQEVVQMEMARMEVAREEVVREEVAREEVAEMEVARLEVRLLGGDRRGEEGPAQREGGLLVGVPGRLGGQTSHQVKHILRSKKVEVSTAHITRNQTNVMYAATWLRLKLF